MRILDRRERPLVRAVQARQPRFATAVLEDARAAARHRGEPSARSRAARLRQVVHLIAVTDAFGALVLYRFRASCERRGHPLLSVLVHHLAVSWCQVSIDDVALIQPGVQIPHGQVEIGGFTEIARGVRIQPFVSIGLVDGSIQGPKIGRDVQIGAGVRILGPVVVGDGAVIGDNAVILRDVAPGAVVAGVPARPVA